MGTDDVDSNITFLLFFSTHTESHVMCEYRLSVFKVSTSNTRRLSRVVSGSFQNFCPRWSILLRRVLILERSY